MAIFSESPHDCNAETCGAHVDLWLTIIHMSVHPLGSVWPIAILLSIVPSTTMYNRRFETRMCLVSGWILPTPAVKSMIVMLETRMKSCMALENSIRTNKNHIISRPESIEQLDVVVFYMMTFSKEGMHRHKWRPKSGSRGSSWGAPTWGPSRGARGWVDDTANWPLFWKE